MFEQHPRTVAHLCGLKFVFYHINVIDDHKRFHRLNNLFRQKKVAQDVCCVEENPSLPRSLVPYSIEAVIKNKKL